MRHLLVLTAFVALLGTSGCGTLFKDDYWDEIHVQSDKDEEARLRDDPTAAFFLGIRTSAAEEPFQLGIPIQFVYAESPAAKAGLREGDELRGIDEYPVVTPGDARWVLARIFRKEAQPELHDPPLPEDYAPRLKTRIVFARDGHEIEAKIELTTREGYLAVRRRRVLDFSQYEPHGWNGWGFYKRRTLPAELVWSYFGVKVDGDVVLAEDWDVLPLVFGISIFRKEDVPLAEATRWTVICSLVQFSTRGDDVARTLAMKGIPEPPAGSTDL